MLGDEEIIPQYNLETTGEAEEELLLKAIKQRVAELLEMNPELLMSYLYRLDVLEVKINEVLSPKNPINPIDSLSALIFERQKKRLETRQKYQSPPLDQWDFE